MTKNDYLKGLRCLSKMTKITRVINWHGITNLIFNLKVKLFIWIYNDIMEH
jgi:hypothetical protein